MKNKQDSLDNEKMKKGMISMNKSNIPYLILVGIFAVLCIIFSAEANKYQEKMEKAEAQLEYIEKELEKTKNDLWLIQAQLGDENGQ